jgi:hypothetical protein
LKEIESNLKEMERKLSYPWTPRREIYGKNLGKKSRRPRSYTKYPRRS